MTGALGTLGLIAEATVRLYPLPEAVRDVSFAYDDVAAAGRAILAVLDSALAATAVQLVAGSHMPARVDVRFEGLEAALEDQSRQLQAIAAGHACQATAAWEARAALWQGAQPALVAKYSVLPADLARVCASVARVAAPLQLRWASAAHALGIGWLRLEGANDEVLLAALARLRSDIQALGGACSVLEAPAAVKARVDVWGQAGAPELMRRVKARFDPDGLFNPGRFVAKI
jgi:glycolate oxidase FAD binding subunit